MGVVGVEPTLFLSVTDLQSAGTHAVVPTHPIKIVYGGKYRNRTYAAILCADLCLANTYNTTLSTFQNFPGLHYKIYRCLFVLLLVTQILAAMLGFEPRTHRFKICCSTSELHGTVNTFYLPSLCFFL